MLTAIKLAHTAIWAVLAASVLAVPATALFGRLAWAMILSGLVLLECGILACNRGRCPLTDLAARYTTKRGDNFDIYLPAWLARYNKAIFGTLFFAGEMVLAWCWLVQP